IPRVRRKRQQEEMVDWDAVTTRHGDLFRRGSDLSGLDWKTVDAVPDHVWLGDQVRASGPSNLVQSGVAPQAPAACEQQLVSAPNASPQPAPICRSAAELAQELRSRLRGQCDRSYHPVIKRLQVRLAGNTT